MKKTLAWVLSVAILVTFVPGAWGIERIPKKDQETKENSALPDSQKKAKEEEKSKPGIKNSAKKLKDKKEIKPEEKKKSKENYDYFLDKNKDGVDDRVEESKNKIKPIKKKSPPQEKRQEDKKRPEKKSTKSRK